MTLRLCGHAAYDKGLYVPAELMDRWRKDDPLPRTRQKLLDVCGLSEAEVASIEAAVEAEVRDAVAQALAVARPQPPRGWPVYADHAAGSGDGNGDGDAASAGAAALAAPQRVEPFAGAGRQKRRCRQSGPRISPGAQPGRLPGRPWTSALYGSAFKTCKGLVERFGAERVIDMPLAESAMVGFALGASQTGGRADRRVPVRRFLHRGRPRNSA